MSTLLSIGMLLGGLALVFYGANFLTDGASSIARRMQVSALVIGLTVVAIGTSTPELAVSLSSAIQGKEGIALGNVLGSNIFNILNILGITAIITPLRVGKSTLYAEIPIVFVISTTLILLANDTLLHNSTINSLDHGDGLVLLFFFFLFMCYTFYIARKKGTKGKDATQQPDSNAPQIKIYGWWLSIGMVIGGLVMLIVGGNLFTEGASAIARALGVSESVIGLTLVAVGTSVPELATSIVAARKGEVDMAIGNIVGSNIFNIALILGTTATIRPIETGGITLLDYGVMLLAVVLLFLFTLFYGKREIKRLEGVALLSVYIIYTVWLILQETSYLA